MNAGAPPLPVFDVLSDAAKFLWVQRRRFLDLSFPAVLGLAMLNTGFALLLIDAETVAATAEFGALGWAVQGALWPLLLILVSALFFWTTFGVAWLRLGLLPKEAQETLATLRWEGRHTRFATYSVALLMLIGFVTLFALVFVSSLAQTQSAALSSALWLLAIASAAAIYARLSQVLPAAAIDHTLRFRESWNLTQGQTGRLLAIFAAAYFLPWLVMGALQAGIVAVLDGSTTFMAIFVRAFTGTFLNYVAFAFLFSVLSAVYDRLRVGRPPSVNLMVS